MRFRGPELPEKMPAPDEKVSAERAARYLPWSATTLRTAAKAGFVQYEVKQAPIKPGRDGFYATLDEWRRGVEAYHNAIRGGVPEDWIGLSEAARRLGVSASLMKNVLRRGLVRCKDVRHGKTLYHYAPPEEWEAALRRYREIVQAPKRRTKDERKQLARQQGMPRAAVSPEEAQRRLAGLTPEQRLNLRTLILAVMRGHPWPPRWKPITVEQAETILGREVS